MERSRPQAEEFTIGWICALHIELTAATAILDVEYEKSDNTSQYTLGKINRHNVVIVCLPAGEIGTGAAAAAAKEMQLRFPSLQVYLMIGIGGGVPSLEADIRLGDVVISVPQRTYGGVVQYDLGKTLSGGSHERTGALSRPNPILLTAVNNLRAKSNARQSDISKHLAAATLLPGFSRHDAGQDVLYRSSYLHIGGTTCNECSKDMVVRRPEREGEQTVVHYGTIASGNQVIRDGLERGRLSAELGGVLCFEMEAAGLMNILQCLVVRGICDYADSHKNKRWQPFAATAAAACAKDILSYVPTLVQNFTWAQMPIRQFRGPEYTTYPNKMDSYDQYTDVATASGRPPLTPAQRQHLLNSLKFAQIETRHATIKMAHTKTCQWLLTLPKYQYWLNNEKLADHHGFLWIKGNPGTGKSTIMKFAFTKAVENSRKDLKNNIVISFFFNARGHQLEKSVLGMYRSLLVQLLENDAALHDIFDSMGLTATPDDILPTWDVETVKALFQKAIERPSRRWITCFIDALDECDEEQVREMVAFLEELGESTVSSQLQFRVCFSSRHYPHIVISKGVELVLDGQEGHHQDITNYVNSEFKGGREVQQFKDEIVKRSSGIFLWAALVVRILNVEYAHGRVRALQKQLNKIPRGLNELFKTILTRDGEHIEELILCLQWVLYAKVPLEREELYFAILTGTEPETVTEWDRLQDTKEVMERYILSSSKGLAEITRPGRYGAQTVQFIHESVRDFLLEGNGLDDLRRGLSNNFPGSSHERLKGCCETYMSIATLKVPLMTPVPLSVKNGFPFLRYAVENVHHHAEAAQSYGILQEIFLERFPLSLWTRIYEGYNLYDLLYEPEVSQLYILAQRDLPNLIRVELKKIPTLDVKGGRYGSPLVAAAVYQNERALRALLMLDFGIELGGGTLVPRESHLSSVSAKDQEEAIRFILRGAHDFKLSPSQSLLAWAAERGHEIVVKLLLETGKVDVEVKDDSERTPLIYAVSNGHEAVARLLLETGKCNPEAMGQRGITPLSWAMLGGHAAVVKLLLDTENVNTEARDACGQTPLLWAASGGHDAIVKLLLQTKKVDVNSKGLSNWTALLCAASRGHESIVKLLLESDRVDVNEKNDESQTALMRAAQEGYAAIVKMLLNVNAVELDCKDEWDQSPLLLAAANGHEAVVKMLLDTGKVDIHSKDKFGRTPLDLASKGGHKAVVQLLGK